MKFKKFLIEADQNMSFIHDFFDRGLDKTTVLVYCDYLEENGENPDLLNTIRMVANNKYPNNKVNVFYKVSEINKKYNQNYIPTTYTDDRNGSWKDYQVFL